MGDILGGAAGDILGAAIEGKLGDILFYPSLLLSLAISFAIAVSGDQYSHNCIYSSN